MFVIISDNSIRVFIGNTKTVNFYKNYKKVLRCVVKRKRNCPRSTKLKFSVFKYLSVAGILSSGIYR